MDARSYQILKPTPTEAASPVAAVSDPEPTAACSASDPTSPLGSNAASGSPSSEEQQHQEQQHESHGTPEQNPVVMVQVVNRQGDGAGVYRFELARRQYGQRRGSWTTLTLTKE